MIYPLPRNISFENWTAQLQNSLSGLRFPNPYPQDKWWDWVDALIMLNPTSNNIPQGTRMVYPNAQDWQKWGQFFLNNLNAG